MNKLIRSEWIKLRTLRTTWILAALAILTAMAITGAATGSVKPGTSAFERVDLLLTPAPLLVRLFVIVLGIMAFSNEYRYGTIIPSLSAAPIRGELLGAKLIVMGAFGLLLGAIVTVASTVTGLAVLSIIGQPVSVFDGEIPRALARHGRVLRDLRGRRCRCRSPGASAHDRDRDPHALGPVR